MFPAPLDDARAAKQVFDRKRSPAFERYLRAATPLTATAPSFVGRLKRSGADDKLGSVREKLAQLRRIERELAALVRACAIAGSEVSCPLIDTLLADAKRSASSIL